MGLLLHLAAETTRCPQFGLELGKAVTIGSLGLVGERMRTAPTLEAALNLFAAQQHRNALGGVVYLLANQREAAFGYAVYLPDVPGALQMCDVMAAAGHSLVLELIGPARAPALRILFCRSKPRDLSPYHACFSGELVFNAPQTALLLPRRLLDLPLATADATLVEMFERPMEDPDPESVTLDVETQVRRALRIQILSGDTSIDAVATRVGRSRRTLQRRLEEAGSGFQHILGEVRCEFAQQLLANTNLEVGEIATIVGYTDPSVLARSFHQWAGLSPSQWRAMKQAN